MNTDIYIFCIHSIINIHTNNVTHIQMHVYVHICMCMWIAAWGNKMAVIVAKHHVRMHVQILYNMQVLLASELK